MTREEAIKMLKAKLECMTRDVSGSDDDCNHKRCDECHLNYEKGNMGEQKEYLNMAIKALEQEPCDDCISREQAKGAIRDRFKDLPSRVEINTILNELPSVTPQPKNGHWEWVQYDYNPKLGNWHCSECRSIAVKCVDKNEKGGIPLYKYCPNCGAKMEVEDNG